MKYRLSSTPRGNFLLVRLARAAEVYETLAEAGIRLGYAPRLPGLEGHLRLTVGPTAEKDDLLSALRSILPGPSTKSHTVGYD